MTSGNKLEKSNLTDSVFKIAPTIGIAIVAYLQTLFPSKEEFDKMHEKLNQMDKKITEITILQKDTSNNSNAIRDLNTRLRQIEIDLAKHHAEDKKNG